MLEAEKGGRSEVGEKGRGEAWPYVLEEEANSKDTCKGDREIRENRKEGGEGVGGEEWGYELHVHV